MKVFFFPDYSGYVYRDLSDISFNETVQGIGGLLNILELHSGKKREEKSSLERILSYKKAIEKYLSTSDASFKESFLVDPFGTSERLLSWRDNLVSYGWKGEVKSQPSRLFEDLKATEKFFSDDSIWERIERIREDVDNGSLLPECLEIVVPFSFQSFHPLIKALLHSLEKRGVNISVNHGTVRYEESDLSRVTSFLSGENDGLELKGDGSFNILSFPTKEDAYRFLAVEGTGDSVYIESHSDVLDNWLKCADKPAVGSTVSGMTEVAGLPILGLRLFKNPLNPEYLLSWLTTPSSPIPSSLGSLLSGEIVSSGGFFNKRCKRKVDEYLSEDLSFSKDEKEREAILSYRRRIVESFLPKKEYYDYGEFVRKEDITSFIGALTEYSLSKQDKSGFPYIYNELKIILSYFSEYERELVPYSEIEALISLISRPLSLVEYEREKGSLTVVPSPFSFVSFPDSIIWNGLDERTGTIISSSFLRPMEKEFVSSLPYFWKEENEMKYQTLSTLIPFRYAKKKMDIVLVSKTESMEDTLQNPFLIRIFQKVKEEEFLKIIKIPTISMDKTKKADVFSNDLGEDNTYVTFSALDRITWPDHESYSSLENLIYHPLDYFMSSILDLNPVGVTEMNKLSSTMGTVAHRVIEVIFSKRSDVEGSGTPVYIENILKERSDRIIDEIIEEKGAILLFNENYNKTLIFRKELKDCLNKLLGVIRENNLVVYATENRFVDVDVSLKDNTPINGSIDMVLENREGDLYIFDFKWSSFFSHYRKLISENLSIQLELYRTALEKETKRKVVAVSYVLLPSLSIFTSSNLKGRRGNITISPERDKPLLDEIKNSFAFRKNEISSGRIEIGEGNPPSLLDYEKNGNDMVPLPLEDDGNKKGNFFSVYGCFKK
ncbi:MAG: PD-(D/E)XK nuclease family protein [Candidatus Ornithospirochaeta sp.]|nr:PD-(D/E)XK nuclease family protein [Sphaerochaetaceae bacterium]MDY5522845.1 PD-(D/E)XK nuclease family protein [Candidatus Ornithospirochaeta sp.]